MTEATRTARQESVDTLFNEAAVISISGDRIPNVIAAATTKNLSLVKSNYQIRLIASSKSKKPIDYITYQIGAHLLDRDQMTKLNTLINSKVLRERKRK